MKPNTPPVTLRPIRPEDEAFLFSVYASTREDELAALGWNGVQKESFLRMQFNAQQRHYHTQFAGATFEVILRENQPIGRLYVDRREDEIRIIDIALLPAHRRAGIGSHLLDRLLTEAAEKGKPVRIHVERFNPALRLYERLGFRRIEDQGVYFLMEWTPDKRRPVATLKEH